MTISDGFDFQRLYEVRHRHVKQEDRQAVWNVIGPYVWDLMGRPNPILDPAAGLGEFVHSLTGVERWLVDAVEFDRQDVEGVMCISGDIMRVDLPKDYFGGVFVSNFLEHLPSQATIARFLRRMLGSLSPGGVIAVLGPNFRYCARTYFDCADHEIALTHVAVEEHLFAAGFEVIRVIPRFLPYSFRGSLPPSPNLTRMYLRSPWAWRLLGRQFLLLGRRPGSHQSIATAQACP